MQNITSMRNPVVQAAKALQSKAGRAEANQFLCDGEHMVAEALQAQPDHVRTIFVQDDCMEQYATLLAQAVQADIYTVPVQVLAAKLSHVLLYALMFVLPLVGWAMISAAGDPVMLGSSLQLPGILPANPGTFAFLRKAHTFLAYLLFFTVLAHLAAALLHGWVRRDGVLESMLRGK